MKLFTVVMLSIAFVAQPAFAHDPPVILPTRLDFDASHAPKKCNDRVSFSTVLGAWVPDELLRDYAERRLIVRIQSTATGGKQADILLVDAQGVVLAEKRTPYASTTECHKVLWDVANKAAELLGAFEPPPPKEAVTCPVCPPCASCPLPTACPTCAPVRATMPTAAPMLTPYRSYVGVGLFAGSGIFSEMAAGPSLLLGFVPSRRLSAMHIELAGAWTSQTSQSRNMHAIPLDASLCWVSGAVQFCGGLSSTISFSNQLRDSLGGHVRVGTELFRRGAFSIRADVFGRVTAPPQPWAATAEPTPFAAGVAILGVWASE